MMQCGKPVLSLLSVFRRSALRKRFLRLEILLSSLFRIFCDDTALSALTLSISIRSDRARARSECSPDYLFRLGDSVYSASSEQASSFQTINHHQSNKNDILQMYDICFIFIRSRERERLEGDSRETGDRDPRDARDSREIEGDRRETQDCAEWAVREA